jgi:2-Cys peroxiredoxin 5
VPGAFTPTCHSQAPGYIEKYDEFKAKGVNEIYIICVNDVFVTKYASASFSLLYEHTPHRFFHLIYAHRAWKEKLAPNGTRKSPNPIS